VLIGLTGTTALILGAVLSPTDPAAVCLVLGGWREHGGHIVCVLEGEAGLDALP